MPPAPPDVREVQRIAAMGDPVLRNLEITHCYSRLTAAVALRTGEGANWCTFATWASRQAGRTVRGEDLLDALARRLRAGAAPRHPIASLWRALLRRGLFRPETRLGRLTRQLHTPFDAFERASDAVSRGNRKVFAEIGLEFARWLHACPQDRGPDAPEVQAFLDGLRPGEPPEGQRYLRQAFARYQRQPFAEGAKARAELLVLANLEIGLHEQTRLQPDIAEALDAALVTTHDLGRRLLEALHPPAARWRPRLRRATAAPLGLLGASAQRAAARVAREAITESLMVLTVPGVVLSLGAHLDAPYPELLREPADPELAALLARFEPPRGQPDDAGARDWSDLAQRMHYIVHLFHAFHARPDLASAPFTPEQVVAFQAGTIPAGEL